MIIDSIGYRVKVFLDFRALSFYKKRKNRVYACLDEGGGTRSDRCKRGRVFPRATEETSSGEGRGLSSAVLFIGWVGRYERNDYGGR